jgi:hypothetical protein
MRLLSKTQSARALNIHFHTFSRLLDRQLIKPTAFHGENNSLFSEMELRKASKYANCVKKGPQELTMTKDKYSLPRVLDDIANGINEPLISADRSVHTQIKRQFGLYASNPREKEILSYIPFSAFQQRADLGGSSFAPLTGIKPSYTTGLISHSQVYRAGATLLEGCQGQVFLDGNTALPQPVFLLSFSDCLTSAVTSALLSRLATSGIFSMSARLAVLDH